METHRVSTSCLAVSWIPSEAVEGAMRVPLDIGLGQYDPPPPDLVEDVDALVAAGHCRFANELTAWADVVDGLIVDAGCEGRSLVASTEMKIGRATIAIPPVAFPEIRGEDRSQKEVTFTHAAGGRTGSPFPRRVPGRTMLKLKAPTAWSQISITIHADGTTSESLVGASRFPRHFFYDPSRTLIAKSATIDFRDWTATEHEADTPWGDKHPSIDLAARETALERTLSTVIMQGGTKPKIRNVDPATELMTMGEPASTVMLILDGLVEVSIDGEVLAESGPGSILGERAALENGLRTSTVRTITPVRIAEIDAQALDHRKLDLLSDGHRREEGLSPD